MKTHQFEDGQTVTGLPGRDGSIEQEHLGRAATQRLFVDLREPRVHAGRVALQQRERFAVLHPDGLHGEEFGAIGERSIRVLEQDSINIAITFSDPAYFQLIELTSSGEVQTHYLSDPKSTPVTEAEFPIERDADIKLRDGPGSCIFAVVCSRQPLEPLSDQQLASIEWSSGHHDGVWQYNNGRLFQMVPPDRSAVTPRVAAPELVSQACDQLSVNNVSVCAIAFPIEPVSRKDP